MAVNTRQLIQWKQQQRPIVVLTAWDYAIARLIDQAGVDVILIGDSLSMVALGYKTTLPVTLEEMAHHAKAVRRGVERALLVCDLPFLTYQENDTQAIASAGKILKETGVEAVKVEGGSPIMAARVAQLTDMGIPVMGHVGLTPQSVHRLGYRQQGKTEQEQQRIIQEAIALAEAGAFAIVLEHIPSPLAQEITSTIAIPTIGIGAGPHCDGQVLVTADILGLSSSAPPFAKTYINLDQIIMGVVEEFSTEVKEGNFPPPSPD